MTSVLLFRVDASRAIGTGHAMRCLALAQAAHDAGYGTAFLSAELPDAIRKRITNEGALVRMLPGKPYGSEDAQETAAIASELDTKLVVVDGYNFDAAYQSMLKEADCTVLFLDDYGHASSYDAQLVLNQNIYADETHYAKRAKDTRLLLGPRYCLLRREFGERRAAEKSAGTAVRLLLTLGGADPDNATGTVLMALHAVEVPLEVTVVIGGGNPHRQELEALMKKLPFPVNVVVDALDMPRLMAEADIAVCAGGSTCYELAFMLVPMMTIVLADNQKAVAAALEKQGCSVNLGPLKTLDGAKVARAVSDLAGDAQKRRMMSRACASIVDGEGTGRVLMQLTGQRIRLRPAKEEDSKMIFDWANDEETRKASFSSDAIAWPTHEEWFSAAIRNPLHRFWIAVDTEDTPVGSIRFALEGSEATLSIGTAPAQRGKGLGAEIVKTGCRKFFATTDIRIIHAYVKPENEASKKLFVKTGFKEEASLTIKERPALHFTFRKT